MHFGLYTAIFTLIFLMMFIIGVTSEVSVSASLIRAVISAVLFTVLTGVLGKVISVYVFPPTQDTEINPEDENLGTNLDLTITDSTDQNTQPEAAVFTDPPNGSGEFIPISARQIDPQVTRIINDDPQKAAEIIRKMGFED